MKGEKGVPGPAGQRVSQCTKKKHCYDKIDITKLRNSIENPLISFNVVRIEIKLFFFVALEHTSPN